MQHLQVNQIDGGAAADLDVFKGRQLVGRLDLGNDFQAALQALDRSGAGDVLTR